MKPIHLASTKTFALFGNPFMMNYLLALLTLVASSQASLAASPCDRAALAAVKNQNLAAATYEFHASHKMPAPGFYTIQIETSGSVVTTYGPIEFRELTMQYDAGSNSCKQITKIRLVSQYDLFQKEYR